MHSRHVDCERRPVLTQPCSRLLILTKATVLRLVHGTHTNSTTAPRLSHTYIHSSNLTDGIADRHILSDTPEICKSTEHPHFICAFITHLLSTFAVVQPYTSHANNVTSHPLNTSFLLAGEHPAWGRTAREPLPGCRRLGMACLGMAR